MSLPFESIDPVAAGFDPEGIASLIEFACDSGSAQLAILMDGRLLVDEVFSSSPVDVYAVQKGLVSLLIGIAEERQLIKLDDSVGDYLPEGWSELSASDEAGLMIRHLLTMTTGMDDRLGSLGQIGENWRYNNTAYNYLKRILSDQTNLSLVELTAQWICNPLGMLQTQWVDRDATLPDGRPLTGLMSTAHDLTRLGVMVLNRGLWNNQRIVPENYLDLMVMSGSEANPAWGLLWWNNSSDHFLVPMAEDKHHVGNIIPTAPSDLIAARGANQNHLGVLPSMKLVVARTALSTAGAKPFEREFYARLLAAFNNVRYYKK
ncbi:MAG: serine hydrolase [Pseudomonadales bacterium]